MKDLRTPQDPRLAEAYLTLSEADVRRLAEGQPLILTQEIITEANRILQRWQQFARWQAGSREPKRPGYPRPKMIRPHEISQDPENPRAIEIPDLRPGAHDL